MRTFLIALTSCAALACTTQNRAIKPTSITGSQACEAGDTLNIRRVPPESVQVRGLPDDAVIRKGYSISSSSNCAFSIQGFVPQGYPYVLLSNQLGARIDLNTSQSSSSVIEPLGKPTMTEIPLHCRRLDLNRWKTTATIARCAERDEILMGATFGKPLDAPVASIGVFQSISRNSAVLLYGYQDLSGLNFLSLGD